MDCCGTGSCDGGLMSSGLTTIINLGGIASEDDYPYAAEDGNVSRGSLTGGCTCYIEHYIFLKWA